MGSSHDVSQVVAGRRVVRYHSRTSRPGYIRGLPVVVLVVVLSSEVIHRRRVMARGDYGTMCWWAGDDDVELRECRGGLCA